MEFSVDIAIVSSNTDGSRSIDPVSNNATQLKAALKATETEACSRYALPHFALARGDKTFRSRRASGN